jgi:type VI secretion system secreted protein VgrG
MNATQANRSIEVTSPFGKDKLLLHRMTVREQLGRPFEIQLDLLSNDHSLKLDDALGQVMTIVLRNEQGAKRYFSGLAAAFTHTGQHGGLAAYRAELVPWIWFLTRTADCRIFQQKTVPEIIQDVFREHGFTDFKNNLSGQYPKQDYCVQYRETDFAFVSRLMEREGIYYFFEYSDGKHQLCLADDYAAHGTAAGYAKVPYYPPTNENRREREHVYDWSIRQSVQSGVYVLNDYDFERPGADLLAKRQIARQHSLAKFELYDYPGEYLVNGEGDRYAQRRIEEKQSEYERAWGSMTVTGLSAGNLFRLEGYPRTDQNREYLLIRSVLQVQNNAYETGVNDSAIDWHCDFEACDSKQPFRSARRTPVPSVQGPQTAVVVGKKGEEIWTDKYGRVKVQFHWDRYGKSDENSSCWVRVAQIWAGKTWGAMHIPRIGQEVIVEFLDGDPDRPIVTGRVYNADEMPPYKLPDNQTQSGIKSRSTKGADAKSFNELRFEDKKGEEQIYFHAEKDFQRVVENNDTLQVGLDKADDGDQTITIHNNQNLTIGNDQSKDGSQIVTVWKDVTQTVKNGDQVLKIEKGSRKSTIKTDDSLTIESGDLKTKVSAGQATIEAAKSITLKVGQSSIKIEPSGITIKSVKVTVKADAQLEMVGAQTQCKGSGQLTLKGGMTMIN